MRIVQTTKDDAVSPVVAIMLMLVVTIIIAAVVSSFAGGLTGTSNSASMVLLSGTYSQTDGLKVQHIGGDTLQTNSISVWVRPTEDFSGSSYLSWNLKKSQISNKYPAPETEAISSTAGTWQYLSTSSGLYWAGVSQFSVGDSFYVNEHNIQPDTGGATTITDTSSLSFNKDTSIGKRFTVELHDSNGKIFAKTDVTITA